MNTPVVALVGNPNTGKSTLFNAITTGARAKVSNLTGTTVECLSGPLSTADGEVELVDVPGTYSLAGRSPEEWVAVHTVLGLHGGAAPDAVILVADAVRLERSLYLGLQLLELGVPVLVAVNLVDEARRQGLEVDAAKLTADLGVPVVAVSARHREGLETLREELGALLQDPTRGTPGPRHPWSEALERDVERVIEVLPERLRKRGAGMARLTLLSLDDPEASPSPDLPAEAIRVILAEAHAAGRDPVVEIVQTPYRWLDAHAPAWRKGTVQTGPTLSDRVDRVVLHPLSGPLLFLTIMTLVFTALFSWADPAVGAIEGLFGSLGAWVSSAFGSNPSPTLAILRDFLVDGLIGGVGAILVFLPQIALLFFFIGVLEDSGYLARAAHLMDRVLRIAGLPGRAFVPLLSGYACAVPAIMATRSMPRFRDRLLTMMVIPLTSCSARLPVYALVIASLFPASLGWFPFVQPLVLLGMYLFSTVITVIAAVVLGKVMLQDSTDQSFIELVPYRLPSPRVVLGSTYRNALHFVQEAGGIILVATIVLWALLAFPRVDPATLLTDEVVAEARAHGATTEDLAQIGSALAMKQTWGGRMGQAIEPVIEPLGFDWRTGVGLLGAFAAREVFVTTLGLVYGIPDATEAGETTLRERILAQRRDDGSKTWTPLSGLSLMVFFALAMQCTSTLAVLVKESKSYAWPTFVLVYMTALAWVSSFLVYQGGLLLGFR